MSRYEIGTLVYDAGKYKDIHFGKKNDKAGYYLAGERMQKDAEEMDLAVRVYETLKRTGAVSNWESLSNVSLYFKGAGIPKQERFPISEQDAMKPPLHPVHSFNLFM